MPRQLLRDGLELAVRVRGRGTPILLCHGFTGSSEAWGKSLIEELALSFQVIAPDLIGHGHSSKPANPNRYTMDAQVDDLCEVLDGLGVPSAIWVGYSMGGRLALGGALRRPQRVQALVLEGASPGLASPPARSERREADDALARRIVADGIAAFVDYWLALPLFASQQSLPKATRIRIRALKLENDPHALAASLRGFGTGSQPALWGDLTSLQPPGLFLAGEKDTKFMALAQEMAALAPDARRQSVANAGHAAHLEAPRAWLACVQDFTARHPQEKSP